MGVFKRLFLASAFVAVATGALAQPVSTLPNASTPLSGNEIIYLIQNGVSSKTTVGNLSGSILISALASPPPIGSGTPNSGAFTVLSATGNLSAAGTFGVTGASTFGGTLSGSGITSLLAPYAPLASPTFTGTISGAAMTLSGTATFATQTFGDNTTKGATTAFVQAAATAAAASAPGCFGVAGNLCNIGAGATALTDGTTPLYFSRIGPAQAPSVGEWQFASPNLGNVTALRDLYYDGSVFGFAAQTVRSIWGYEHGAFGCDPSGNGGARPTTVSANVTISGNVMTVLPGLTGTITAFMDILIPGLYTANVAGPLPMVVQQLTGTTGGAGTYQISSATGDPRTLSISVPSSTAATMGVDPTASCNRDFIEISDGLLSGANTVPNEFSLLQSYATGGVRTQHVMLDITTTGGGDNIGDMYWDRQSGGGGNILHSIHSNGFMAVSGTVSGTAPADAFDVYLASANCMVVGREANNRGACSFGVNGEDLEIHSPTPIVRWRTDNTAAADLFLDATNKRLGVMDIFNGATEAPAWFYVDGTQNVWLQGGAQVGAPTGGFKGTGTLNVAGAVYANGTAGLTCSGTPSSSFASVGGIVTHC